MGTGWRRAFCTSTLPRNSDVDAMADDQLRTDTSPIPRSCTRLAFFSSSSNSNPTTPRLHCRTSAPTLPADDSPALRCKTATHKVSKSPRLRSLFSSNSASTSPRSPLKLSLFRNSFKSRNNCGVCAQSVKTGQGTAIYMAECGHGFHFPCIASHARKELKLVCPVCSVDWKDVPLLAVVHPSSEVQKQQDKTTIAQTKISTPKMEQKIKTTSSSPKQQQYHHNHHCELKPVTTIRAYDDDESLLTPTAGSKFNPIPEADENEGDEDEVGEFQGFFVKPIQSCSIKSATGNNNGGIIHSSVEVKPMPEAAILSVNATHETYAVALRVKAPSTPSRPDQTQSQSQSRRPPVDLVAVLDVSMSGAKLYTLKRAMKLIISSLGSADRLSIVAFSGVTKRLLPLRRMTSLGQRSAKHIVDCLTSGQTGSTAGDALKKAVKVLEDRKERNPSSTIILFSDDHDDLRRRNQPSRYELVNVPVNDTSYGKIGSEINDTGFAKFVNASLTLVAQDLRMKLNLNLGEIAAVYCNDFKPTLLGSSTIRLGDLYADEERELLVEIRIPRGTKSNSKPILTANCSYRSPTTREAINCREESTLPKLQPIRSTAQKIERLRNLFIVTRAIAEARGCDLVHARCLLVSARALVLQSSTTEGTAAEYVRGLEMELMEVARREKEVERRRRRKEEWGGLVDENGEPLTPTSAWRAAEMLAKVAMVKKSLNKVSDLHGFENARF